MKTFRRTILAIFAFGFALTWFAFSQKTATETPIDAQSYQDWMAHQVMDIDDLEDLIRDERDGYALLTVPDESYVLRQPVYPILPFSWAQFPKEWAALLGESYVYEYSVPVYTLRAIENRLTRHLDIYGKDNKILFSMAAPMGYDPFAWLKSRYPGLYSGRYAASEVASYEAAYDPARVELIVKLIPTEYVEHYLYAQAKVLESQRALEPEDEGGMMMLMGESDELRITAMFRQTNGILLELSYPEGFTNTVDVFGSRHLPEGVWYLLDTGLIPDGTNSIAWLLDPSRDYEAVTISGFADSDFDGYPDAHEFLLYGTNPDDDSSFPVTVQGEITYSGIETGAVHLLMIPEGADPWSMARAITLQGPGAFTSAPVANLSTYEVRAYRDPNGSGKYAAWKPMGEYPSPLYLSDNVTNIQIHVEDVPSLWGTISYSGSATGDVYVIAIPEAGWDATYQNMLPWVQSFGSLTGDPVYISFPIDYAITGLPPGEYLVRAWIDENGDGQYTHLEPGGQFAVDPIAISNRVTGIDFTIALDTDDDGLPDWWEMEHFGGSTNAVASADDDGDEMHNLREYRFGTDPGNQDTVTELTPGMLTIAYKSRQAERHKFKDFPSFIPADPPLYYLKLVRADTYDGQDWEPDCTRLFKWDDEYNLALTIDPSVMEISGTGTYEGYSQIEVSNSVVYESWSDEVTTWTTNHGVSIWMHYDAVTNYYTVTNRFCGVGYTGPWNAYYHGSYNPAYLTMTYTDAVVSANSFVREGREDDSDEGGCYFSEFQWTYTLSLPYTRDLLEDLTEDDLEGLGLTYPWQGMNWSQRMKRIIPSSLCDAATLESDATATSLKSSLRSLVETEESMALRETAYRFTVVTEAGVPYRLSWMEFFDSTDDGANNQVVRYQEAWFMGDGTTKYVGNPENDASPSQYIELDEPDEGMDFVMQPPSVQMGNGRVEIMTALSVNLIMSRADAMTLLETNNLTVILTPTNVIPTEISIEIKRHGSTTWHTLADVYLHEWIGRISGNFILRATVDIEGMTYYSGEMHFEVSFPTFAQITAVPNVAAALDAAWNSTITFASQTQSREEGFYILIDTEAGVYELAQTTYGPVVSPTNIANGTANVYMSIPSPSMEFVPAPNGSGTTYTVAHMHTHTPTFYWPMPTPPQRYIRDVGPSASDNQTYSSYGIPGVIYDYIEDSVAVSNGFPGVILDGHPLPAAAQLYSSGPSVRLTD